LRHLVGKGYRQFTFVDDSFTLNQKRVVELCRGIRKEGLDVEFICEGRVDSCSYEMLGELARTGCRVIYFGIESANQRVLDYYRKNITPEQSRKTVELARKAGIDVIVGSFVLGAPDETREEIYNTVTFAKRILIDLPQFNILGAYPGMDIWNELKMKGFLNEDEHWETGATISAICPDAVPLKEIKQIVHYSFYDFFRRPGFIMGQMARTMKSSYRREVIINNLSRLGSIRANLRNFA
jgi:anaerobic magnesium-protoporphyrin IX monomethyl ester cyclase